MRQTSERNFLLFVFPVLRTFSILFPILTSDVEQSKNFWFLIGFRISLCRALSVFWNARLQSFVCRPSSYFVVRCTYTPSAQLRAPGTREGYRRWRRTTLERETERQIQKERETGRGRERERVEVEGNSKNKGKERRRHSEEKEGGGGREREESDRERRETENATLTRYTQAEHFTLTLTSPAWSGLSADSLFCFLSLSLFVHFQLSMLCL